MRNLRMVRLSIFSKLLIGLDLRIGFRVRVLPGEPFFSSDTCVGRFPNKSLVLPENRRTQRVPKLRRESEA